MKKHLLVVFALFCFTITSAFAQDSLKLKTVEMVINGQSFHGVHSAKGQTLFIDKKGKMIKRLSGDSRIKDDVYAIETTGRKRSVTTYTCKELADKPTYPQSITVDSDKKRIRFQPIKNQLKPDSLPSYVEYFY